MNNIGYAYKLLPQWFKDRIKNNDTCDCAVCKKLGETIKADACE